MTQGSSPIEALNAPVPVLSNRALLSLIESNHITIDPFDPDALAPTAYRLRPHRLRFKAEDDDGIPLADQVRHLSHGQEYTLRPGESIIISPRERILVKPGFVVDFYASSWCVENKLILTAGRLDSGYNADLVFGVFNSGRMDVGLSTDFQLARASFAWLGPSNVPSYGERPPGAYIPQLAELRKREEELNTAEEELKRQRNELARRRQEILREQK